MTPRVYRNHVSVVASNLLTAAIILVLATSSMLGNPEVPIIQVIVLYSIILLVAVPLTIVWWWRTTYTFTETEINIRVDTVFKRDKHISYSRLASVNVRRSVMDVLFGTSTLTFNVNSSVNSTEPEGSLRLRRAEADALREELSLRIFRTEMKVEEDLGMESLIRVSNLDVVLHGMIGKPTYMLLFSSLMLVYAVAMLFLDNSGGFFTAAMLFVLSELVPMVRIILRYYNYRVYRNGDTITVESGLISQYRSSFNINRVNSVRIRQPLIARMIGRSTLEAEVVGMANGETSPILCPLKRSSEVRDLARILMPEYVFDCVGVLQPRSALVPMVVTQGLLSLAVVSVVAALSICCVPDDAPPLVRPTLVVAGFSVPVLLLLHIPLAQRNRSIAFGGDTFMFVYGSYDLKTEFMLYDKIQTVRVSAGPVQRATGTSKCTVGMMSSAGVTSVTSGLFDHAELDEVSDRIVGRIRDGSYDYRRYV